MDGQWTKYFMWPPDLPEHSKAGQVCISWRKYTLGQRGCVICSIFRTINLVKLIVDLWSGAEKCVTGGTKHCPQITDTVHDGEVCRSLQNVDMLILIVYGHISCKWRNSVIHTLPFALAYLIFCRGCHAALGIAPFAEYHEICCIWRKTALSC